MSDATEPLAGLRRWRRHPQALSRGRDLALVLGDQLWLGNPALQAAADAGGEVLMIEAAGEASHVASHKARIALFLSAMRHFCNQLHQAGWHWHYLTLDDLPEQSGFGERLQTVLAELQPQRLWACEPGDLRLMQDIEQAAERAGVPLHWLGDTHFICSRARFAQWAKGRKELRMEFFYREMRRDNGVLMEGREPVGGRWNFDADNREGYPKAGPGAIPDPAWFAPDATTREVLDLVQRRFADHPGSLDDFAWPVTREHALTALDRFVEARLPRFGRHQDAMWTGTPWGWHALLSTSLNLHLLDPREVIAAAERAWRERGLELASVEGFIRQVLGWREFIRGVYWHEMPALGQANHYQHQRELPQWYWSGNTRMNCMREVLGQTLRHAYSHHIQRLMVTGQFALLAQVRPQAVCDWYLAMYVDAVEWVELPNTAGMALHADGGRFTSKPYIASGQYIKRMSNFCQGCAYRPEQRSGAQACPVTLLYWNFLDTHEATLARNPRTALMAKSVGRLDAAERQAIRQQAAQLIEQIDQA